MSNGDKNDKDGPELVTILAKEPKARPDVFKFRRPLAIAEIADEGLRFHGQIVPDSHTLLMLKALDVRETIQPFSGGELGYRDPIEEYINLSQVDVGALFHWPTDLIQRNELPSDYEADLQALVQGIDEESIEEDSDPAIAKARAGTLKARGAMVKKYSKKHTIEVFAIGDIVSMALPRLTRTSTNMKRIWGRVLSVPYSDRYEIQTKWGVLDRKVVTRHLQRVPRSVADGLDVNGPRKLVSMKFIAENASSSDRVIISCKCKNKCGTKRCRCFKEGVKCSVHCHDSAEHDCGFLASLSYRTELAIKEKETREEGLGKGKGKKRARSNTKGEHVER